MSNLVGLQVTYTVNGSFPSPLPSGCPYSNIYGSGNFQQLCTWDAGYANCPVEQILDKDLNAIVSGTSPAPAPTTNWIVGLQKNIAAQVQTSSGSGSYSTNATFWSIPPNLVTSYNFGANMTVAPTPLPTPTTATVPSFYWSAGNNSNPQPIVAAQWLTRSNNNQNGTETAVVTSNSAQYQVNTPASVAFNPSTNLVDVGHLFSWKQLLLSRSR